MSNELTASLIITTYNWPEALKITLDTVIRQSEPPREVIIADDGSGPETAQAIKDILGQTSFRWCHVRHDDNGIRQARIKNLGVKYSTGSYLIFIDHDVVLHPEFVIDHIKSAEDGIFLQGKRSFMSEGMTKATLSNITYKIPTVFSEGLENRKNALHSFKLGRLLARPKRFQTSLRGCNLSMHKKDFLKVDGYDETFDQLWGREDSDICYRLFHSGLKVKNLWFSALQYHLYHIVKKNKEKDRLDQELDKVIKGRRTKAIKGFSSLSDEGEIIASS